MSRLLALPENAVMLVLSRLQRRDLLNVASTCRVLHGLAFSDYQWMRLCEPWRVHVDLEKWRAGVGSACALFRLLSSFSKLVGHWSAPGLEPRGGLLYITWGHLSVLAYRIIVLETDDLKMQHLFDVVGLPDGCTTTKIFTACSTPAGRRGLSLSGALVWSSPYDEFYLELAEHCEVSPHDMEQLDGLSKSEIPSIMTDSNEGMVPPDTLQFSHIVKLLETSFGMGQYDDEGEACLSVDGNHRVLHLTSRRQVVGSIYSRLIVEENSKENPFAGLWAGLYGPHGMEIVNITYIRSEIIATKVVGDENVPCGKITFKANMDTESSDIPLHFQGLVNGQYTTDVRLFIPAKMYEGYGQIADVGFVDPQWIPGKLLVDHENKIAFSWDDDEDAIIYKKVPSLYDQQREFLVSPDM